MLFKYKNDQIYFILDGEVRWSRVHKLDYPLKESCIPLSEWDDHLLDFTKLEADSYKEALTLIKLLT